VGWGRVCQSDPRHLTRYMDSTPDFAGFEGPILDLEVIEGLRELGGKEDPGLVLELVEMFLVDALRHLESMTRAFEEGDLEGMTRSAHTLKSASANMGVMLLNQVCKDLEDAARDEDLESYRSLVEICKNAYARSEQALRPLR